MEHLPRFAQFRSIAVDLPQGDDVVWRCHRIVWKQPETWVPHLTAWLEPRLRKDGWKRLKPGTFRDLCWDDWDWLGVLQAGLLADVESVAVSLADALDGATLRAYHGCRTDDAGSYFKEGLRVHRREALRKKIQEIVDSEAELGWIRNLIDQRIDAVNNRTDEGRLWLVADDSSMLTRSAHYLVYGSEWISAVLGASGKRFLKTCGVPTLIEVDLPLSFTRPSIRSEFAKAMLQEWIRLACNGTDWIAPIDFSISLQFDLSAEYVVGHYHPSEMNDPHDRTGVYRSPHTSCAFCAPSG